MNLKVDRMHNENSTMWHLNFPHRAVKPWQSYFTLLQTDAWRDELEGARKAARGAEVPAGAGFGSDGERSLGRQVVSGGGDRTLRGVYLPQMLLPRLKRFSNHSR